MRRNQPSIKKAQRLKKCNTNHINVSLVHGTKRITHTWTQDQIAAILISKCARKEVLGFIFLYKSTSLAYPDLVTNGKSDLVSSILNMVVLN